MSLPFSARRTGGLIARQKNSSSPLSYAIFLVRTRFCNGYCTRVLPRSWRGFLPLTQEEVLTTVLPALTLPYWQYHADESADREMGILLWQRVCPSFRKLRVVLQYASQIARARQAERITPEILTETFRLTLIPHVPAPRPIDPTEERGSYEAASQQKPPRF